MSLLDELNSNRVDVRSVAGEETGLVPSDFNYAWVVPVVVTDLNRELYELQLEKMRYIINALSDDNRVLVVDNWMVPKMGYINKGLDERIKNQSAGFKEIFIMFNFTPSMRPKQWLNLIFWSAAQLANICCEVDAATCLLAYCDKDNKMRRIATLVYNPNILHIRDMAETHYLPTTRYVREALTECMNGIVSFTEIMQYINRIQHRWMHARTGNAVNVAIADDSLLNYPNNLADACSSSR